MRPAPLTTFDADTMLGTWSIVVTNYGYWRHRHNPTVTYEVRPASDGKRTWRDTLRYTTRRFGKERPGRLAGVDVEQERGHFIWRGDGILKLVKSPWWVLMQADEWAVTYFARSNVGTAPGMDIYGRQPELRGELMRDILGRVRAHPFLKDHCEGLYTIVHGSLAGDRYASCGVASPP